MQFLGWKMLPLTQISLKFIPADPKRQLDNYSSLVVTRPQCDWVLYLAQSVCLDHGELNEFTFLNTESTFFSRVSERVAQPGRLQLVSRILLRRRWVKMRKYPSLTWQYCWSLNCKLMKKKILPMLLTLCRLVTPYCDIELGQHRLW